MSRQEFHIGKLKSTGLDLTEWMFQNQDLVEDYYKGQNDLREIFYNGLKCGYDKYVLLDGYEIYEVVKDVEQEDYDIFQMKANHDGTLDYVVSFYNGGCSLSEALQYAKEKMSE